MSFQNGISNAIYRFLYALTGPGKGISVILLYHSVSRKRVVSSYSIPLVAFEQQMEFVKARFKVVCLCDLLKAIETETSGVNIACVTFDDGSLDNYEIVLPVLERLNIKATFFITTGLLGHAIQTYEGSITIMHKEHVRELHALGYEVGAHTVNHPKLTRLPIEQARNEIETSKKFLEDLLGTQLVSFAYPKGDYNDTIKHEVAKLGFRAAVTIREGLVFSTSDWLALPRVWISSHLSHYGFAAKLSPAIEWYERLRRKVKNR